MRTNVNIDDGLIDECVKLTGLRTKKDIVDLALRELIKRRKRQRIFEYEGKLTWDGNVRKMRKDRQ